MNETCSLNGRVEKKKKKTTVIQMIFCVYTMSREHKGSAGGPLTLQFGRSFCGVKYYSAVLVSAANSTVSTSPPHTDFIGGIKELSVANSNSPCIVLIRR